MRGIGEAGSAAGLRIFFDAIMPVLVTGIHALVSKLKTWMAGTSPAMTLGDVEVRPTDHNVVCHSTGTCS